MAQGRVGVGVALLLAFAGPVAAQPSGYPSFSGGGVMPLAPAAPGPIAPDAPPALFPPGVARVSTPALVPPGQPPATNVQPNPPSHIQTLSAFADDHPPMKELPTGLPELIPPPDKHHGGHEHGCGHGCEHEIPEWLAPFVPHHGWYTQGEFLLMRPRYTDFDYAIRNANPGLGTVGPIESLKYDTGTGFRVEVGRHWGEGKWDSAFAYTYFNGNGDASAAAGLNQVLLPTLTRPGLTDRALSALVNADLDYQLYDIIVGRRMMVDENFALRWLGGVRFADVRQIFNTFYDGLDARRAAVVTRSRFQGFGPLVGAEAVLGGWRGFHLYARASGGLLTGNSTNRLIETNDNGATTYIDTRHDVRKVVPMGTIAVGGGWQYRTFWVRGGYEVSHWQGIFERPRFVDDVSQGKVITRPGNLTLEGLFIQVGVNF